MINLTRQRDIPIKREKLLSDDPNVVYDYFKNVFQRIDNIFKDIIDNLYWTPRYFKQNSRPTPDKREIVLWKDSDAAAGDPTHYLVIKDPDDNVVTFSSEETA